ncbi:MAG: tetratricopeptide repeat protein, partial [Holophagales bacterium]|nr:tetratricopeptide repeat protein [Holophagales bacterium]
SAVPRLRRALELAPGDPDAGWLLGRAQTAMGEGEAAIATFERSAETARASGRRIPAWAHNEWGASLARAGRSMEALDHFRESLAENPGDAQALFYTGLVYEGIGRVEEGIEYYCLSMQSQPNPPAAGRLRDLGRTCGLGVPPVFKIP